MHLTATLLGTRCPDLVGPPFSLPISLFVHNDMRVIVHWICWWLINDANLLFPPHPQSCPIGLRSGQLSFVAEATGVHWIDWQEIS